MASSFSATPTQLKRAVEILNTSGADEKSAPEPELLLQLECAEAPVTLKKITVTKFHPEWGDDKQPAVELRVQLESADPQLIPDEYMDAVTAIQAVSQRGPDDKSNSVRMGVNHEIKRSTYRLQLLKRARLEFSSEAKTPTVAISKDGVALRWRVQFIIPAGRLIDLVRMLDAENGDVVVTIESLQLDMWSN